MLTLDTTFEVKDRTVPDWLARQIKRVLESRNGAPTRVTFGEPLRTRKQDRTYFKFLEWIAAAYYDRGETKPKDLLHEWYKILFLPIVAAQIEHETGEQVDIGKHWTFPDGSERFDYSITGLTKQAMARYIDLIAADDDVVAMNVPVPSLDTLGMENPHRNGARRRKAA